MLLCTRDDVRYGRAAAAAAEKHHHDQLLKQFLGSRAVWMRNTAEATTTTESKANRRALKHTEGKGRDGARETFDGGGVCGEADWLFPDRISGAAFVFIGNYLHSSTHIAETVFTTAAAGVVLRAFTRLHGSSTHPLLPVLKRGPVTPLAPMPPAPIREVRVFFRFSATPHPLTHVTQRARDPRKTYPTRGKR